MHLICPICGSKSHETLKINAKEGIKKLLLCTSCSHAWAENFHLQHSLKTYYDEYYNHKSYNLPIKNAKQLLIGKRLNAACKGFGSILDIGCGTGDFLFNLHPSWIKHGVELVKKRAEITRLYTSANVQTNFIEDCDYEPETFQCVTMFAVIEHISNPNLIIDKVWEILKPGGVFMLMTGDRTSRKAVRNGTEWRLYKAYGHLHFFSKLSLDLLLANRGFIIEEHVWRFSFEKHHQNLFIQYMLWGIQVLWEIFPQLLRQNYGDEIYVLCRKP